MVCITYVIGGFEPAWLPRWASFTARAGVHDIGELDIVGQFLLRAAPEMHFRHLVVVSC